MTMVTLDVAGLKDGLAAFRDAWTSGKAESGARISFASPELLWSVLTPPRWEILRDMTGRGPVEPNDVARRLGRDGNAVATDLDALTQAGLLQKATDGRFEFPFDAVHIDFILRAA